MRLEKWLYIGGVVLIGFFLLTETFYIVDETQQAVITEFGDPVGKSITEAGLYLKKPFIHKVNSFDERLLTWDGKATQISTKDKKYIWMDITARWRIVDPLEFLQSVGNERSAQARLDDIIDSATRDQIAAHLLYEIVRNSNREFVTAEASVEEREKIGRVEKGRETITRRILEEATKLTPQHGINLVDVRVKRINYVEQVRKKVYDRMISERERVTQRYRSQGRGEAEEIAGKREKELQKITSRAYKRAQIIKGRADAKATKIYSQAHSKDPEFYSFLQTLDTYQKSLSGNSTIILTTDSDVYRYLKSIKK